MKIVCKKAIFGLLEIGEWRMEIGDWRMKNGNWRIEIGEWRLEIGELFTFLQFFFSSLDTCS